MPIFSSGRRCALLLAIALPLVSGCASDDKLSASATYQGIIRALWVGDMLNRSLTFTAPLLEAPETSDLAEAHNVLREYYGDCADITAQDEQLTVSFVTPCTATRDQCSGSFQLAQRSATVAGIRVQKFHFEHFEDLECNGQVLDGTIALQPLPVTDEQSDPWMLHIEGMSHTDTRQQGDDWQSYPAADLFQGQFSVRVSHIETPAIGDSSGQRIDLWLVKGEGTFRDIEINRLFDIDAIDLGVTDNTSYPRTGDLALEVPDTIHSFHTSWLPLTPTATQVTVTRGKQSWTGCIAHADAQECQTFGH